MQTYSSTIIAALKRAPTSVLKRNKASLQQLQVDPRGATAPFDLNINNVHQINREKPPTNEIFNFGPSLKIKTLLQDVKVGEIDYATWGQCKNLLIQACKQENAELATQILNRLTKECLSSQYRLELNESHFNIVMYTWARKKQPEQAENVFIQMLHSNSRDSFRIPPPKRPTYNALLSAWAGSGSPNSVDKVLEILEEMESSQDDKPDRSTYNKIMSCYANLVGEYEAAKAAEDILLRFAERHNQGLIYEGPQTTCFNIVIKAWSNHRDEMGADRAHQIFSLMEKLHDDGHENVKPNADSLVYIMDSYAKKGDLETIEKLLQTADVDGDPTKYIDYAISAHAKSGHPNAADRAEDILAQMEHATEDSYRIVMQAHASSDRPDAANRCEISLKKMIKNHLNHKSGIRPGKKSFQIVLQAWQNHHNKEEAAERALALVKCMIKLTEEWKMETKPDEKICDNLIELWSKVNVGKAYEILEWMEEQDITLWKHSYNTVMQAFNERKEKNNNDSIEKVLKLLHRLESRGMARTYSYNLVLFCLTKEKSSISKQDSLKILEVMEDAFQKGDEDKRPDIRTYTAVLQTLAYYPRREDTAIAIDIFRRMVRLDNDPNSKDQMDAVACKILLLLLSRVEHSDAADAATDILNRMLKPGSSVYPDPSHQHLAILANARSLTKRHVLTAYDLLFKTSRLFLDGTLKHSPHPASFTGVLHALSKIPNIDSVQKGIEILDLMKELKIESLPNIATYTAFFRILANNTNNIGGFDAEKILHSIPNKDTALWNCVLHVWGYSGHANKACETQRCFREMQDANIRPDVVSYNAVLSAAANLRIKSPKHKEEAMKIALETFEELNNSEHTELDYNSYRYMIMCYRTLMEPSQERLNCVRDIFDDCKENGKVGTIILKELHDALTPVDFEKWTNIIAQKKGLSTKVRTLPKSWTRNIGRELYKAEDYER